jgi:hypothetical protein
LRERELGQTFVRGLLARYFNFSAALYLATLQRNVATFWQAIATFGNVNGPYLTLKNG